MISVFEEEVLWRPEALLASPNGLSEIESAQNVARERDWRSVAQASDCEPII